MLHLEMQMKQVADVNTQLAEAFERPLPQASFGYFLHFLSIPGLEHQRIEARTRIECHPLPNAQQAKALRERFAGPLEQSIRHVVKAMQTAAERIQGGPETPSRQRALNDVAAWEARAEEDLQRLEAAGSDDLDWFRRATTPRAGERPNEFPHIPGPTREEQLDRDEQMRALEFAMRRLVPKPER